MDNKLHAAFYFEVMECNSFWYNLNNFYLPLIEHLFLLRVAEKIHLMIGQMRQNKRQSVDHKHLAFRFNFRNIQVDYKKLSRHLGPELSTKVKIHINTSNKTFQYKKLRVVF